MAAHILSIENYFKAGISSLSKTPSSYDWTRRFNTGKIDSVLIKQAGKTETNRSPYMQQIWSNKINIKAQACYQYLTSRLMYRDALWKIGGVQRGRNGSIMIHCHSQRRGSVVCIV